MSSEWKNRESLVQLFENNAQANSLFTVVRTTVETMLRAQLTKTGLTKPPASSGWRLDVEFVKCNGGTGYCTDSRVQNVKNIDPSVFADTILTQVKNTLGVSYGGAVKMTNSEETDIINTAVLNYQNDIVNSMLPVVGKPNRFNLFMEHFYGMSERFKGTTFDASCPRLSSEDVCFILSLNFTYNLFYRLASKNTGAQFISKVANGGTSPNAPDQPPPEIQPPPTTTTTTDTPPFQAPPVVQAPPPSIVMPIDTPSAALSTSKSSNLPLIIGGVCAVVIGLGIFMYMYFTKDDDKRENRVS